VRPLRTDRAAWATSEMSSSLQLQPLLLSCDVRGPHCSVPAANLVALLVRQQQPGGLE
jgi:hypothetical protein